MPNDDDLLTTRDVAELIGLSVMTVGRRVAAGKLAPARVLPGGRYGTYLFARSEVERFIEAEQEQAAS